MARRSVFGISHKAVIHMKNGKTIERVIYKNAQGYNYVKYNGHIMFVEFYCGRYYEEYA
jgi:hypothetical protein